VVEEARPVCYVFFARLLAIVIRVRHNARGLLCVRARQEKAPRAGAESRKSAGVTGQVLCGRASVLGLGLVTHALLRGERLTRTSKLTLLLGTKGGVKVQMFPNFWKGEWQMRRAAAGQKRK
jgi:hypothetical protein